MAGLPRRPDREATMASDLLAATAVASLDTTPPVNWRPVRGSGPAAGADNFCWGGKETWTTYLLFSE